MKKRYLIPSLIAAGLFPAQSAAIAAIRPDDDADTSFSLFDLFQQTRAQVISAHRSHSSHSSHRSHRSSSGGSYTAPRVYTPPTTNWPPAVTSPSRNYNSTAPSSILPSPPAAAPKAAPEAVDPALADKFKGIVKAVQLALFSYGYYTGPVDGVVGSETSTAISRMQADYGLKVTGTVTPEVLSALKISDN